MKFGGSKSEMNWLPYFLAAATVMVLTLFNIDEDVTLADFLVLALISALWPLSLILIFISECGNIILIKGKNK